MIITDGKESIKINNNKLFKTGVSNLKIKSKLKYWMVELVFIRNDKGFVEKIVKRLPEGDTIKEYNNLDLSRKNFVTLNYKDYEEISRIYFKMINSVNIQKDAIVEAGAILLSFEWYQNYVLEENDYISVNELFDDVLELGYNYRRYKNEIIKRSKAILKEKYEYEV